MKKLSIIILCLVLALSFCACGAKNADGEFITAGGRVLGVSCVRPTLEKAIEAAYEASNQIHFEGMHMRTDIGKRALECLK